MTRDCPQAAGEADVITVLYAYLLLCTKNHTIKPNPQKIHTNMYPIALR